MIHCLKQCQRELDDFPEEIKGDLADVLARIDEGHRLSLPLSRPMPSIGSGVHELRLRDPSGIYRIVYVYKKGGDVWLIHAFQKKTRATTKHDIDLAKKRLLEVL